MTNFKGTKGKWFYCETSKGVKSNNVKGLLATAWSVYNSDEVEQRLEGESWLDMRNRTEHIRNEKELEMKANAKLIACAPEMLEMLENLIDVELFDLEKGEPTESYYQYFNQIEQLIKKATDE